MLATVSKSLVTSTVWSWSLDGRLALKRLKKISSVTGVCRVINNYLRRSPKMATKFYRSFHFNPKNLPCNAWSWAFSHSLAFRKSFSWSAAASLLMPDTLSNTLSSFCSRAQGSGRRSTLTWIGMFFNKQYWGRFASKKTHFLPGDSERYSKHCDKFCEQHGLNRRRFL